ncbi:hypothetical protein ACFSO0_02185 [Brevibacillus sp. GCM10020057]|uniref:GAP1-N2 domain-containing protein n=1 Tax=Brevibacillus sp. GCM10020057 TaxID=3317327 RepID=UPI003630AF54
MSRQPIMQQYYTRGRQGIFRSNEGYDTVAKSPRLDNAFIKKTLHPFCAYDAPRQLQERGESNLKRYPEAFVCFRAETGELVVGRSVFVGADFTGQRNTFFSHNYVIPAQRRDEFVKDPARLFGLNAFADYHDDAAGKELPELDELPFQVDGTPERRRWLDSIGIDEQVFRQLLYAVMTSLSTRRKVYISLPGEPADASYDARKLLEILYSCLPYEMRRHFGFLTYSSEPQSKKHIHVMFVEKGSIRAGAQITEKDFLFDLANGRIPQADALEGKHVYLDYAWEHVDEPRLLAQFHDFCEEVLAGADTDMQLRLSACYELCTLYGIESGNMAAWVQNRAGIWQVLQHYLNQVQLQDKTRLLRLRDTLFRAEAKSLAVKRLPDSETIRQMLGAYRAVSGERVSGELVTHLMKLLLQAKAAQQSAYAADVYRQLAEWPELFAYFMRSVLGCKELVKPLFEDYLAERLASFSQMDQVLQEFVFWSRTAPPALHNPFFLAAAREKMLRLFACEQHPLQAVLHIHDFFMRQDGFDRYAGELLDELDKSLLGQLALDALAWSDFGKIMNLLEDKPQTFFGGLNLESRQKLEYIAQMAALADSREVPLPEPFFRQWDERETAFLQKLITGLLEHPLEPDSFPLVALAFYRTGQKRQDSFAYADMLRFVGESGGDEAVYAFVLWSMTQRMFFTAKSISPGYRQVLKSFLLENNGRRLRDKAWKKRWLAVRHADFRKLLDEVRSETASPLLKLFRKRSTAMVSIFLLLAAGAVASFFLLAPDSKADLPVSPTGAETARQPLPAEAVKFVPAYQLMLEPQIRPVNTAR